ncbi:MAG: hypothetical protein RLZZ70_738 [Candidatus Parcubacteria bacterium]|jgi:hypothetical protein
MKDKKTNIIVLIGSFLTLVIMNFWWMYCIDSQACSYDLIRVWLRPLYYGSLALTGFFAAFLILPSHYFKAWFRWIFSWAFPISVLIVMSNVSTGGGLFPIFAREVIILLSYFWGGISLLFVVWQWWSCRTRKN